MSAPDEILLPNKVALFLYVPTNLTIRFAIHHGELHWRNNSTQRFEVVPALQSKMARSTSSPSLNAANNR
jgi:hypothetical protein